MITLAVTVIKLITLRPLLEDRGHITKQSSVCHTHFCVRYSIKYFGEAVSRHSPAAPRGNCPALVTPLSCGPVLAVLVPLLSRPSSRWPGTATLRAGRPDVGTMCATINTTVKFAPIRFIGVGLAMHEVTGLTVILVEARPPWASWSPQAYYVLPV